MIALAAVAPVAFAADSLPPLDGVWAEDRCKSSKIEPYRKQEFWGFQTDIVQAINSMVYFAQDDRNCGDLPVFSINTYYEYNADEIPDEGFAEIDFVIEKITFQTRSKELAKQLRKERACGLKNWVAGREINISARECFEQKFREPLDKLYAEYNLDSDLNLVMTKKLQKSAKKRGKGKKQTFVKIEDFR